jgi:hypothetical protein
MWLGISKYERLIFISKLKEISCEVDSVGSGYGPAAFVRVNALGSNKCLKIS